MTEEEQFRNYLARKKAANDITAPIIEKDDDFEEQEYDEPRYAPPRQAQRKQVQVQSQRPVQQMTRQTRPATNSGDMLDEIREQIDELVDDVFYNFGMRGLQKVLDSIEEAKEVLDGGMSMRESYQRQQPRYSDKYAAPSYQQYTPQPRYEQPVATQQGGCPANERAAVMDALFGGGNNDTQQPRMEYANYHYEVGDMIPNQPAQVPSYNYALEPVQSTVPVTESYQVPSFEPATNEDEVAEEVTEPTEIQTEPVLEQPVPSKPTRKKKAKSE